MPVQGSRPASPSSVRHAPDHPVLLTHPLTCASALQCRPTMSTCAKQSQRFWQLPGAPRVWTRTCACWRSASGSCCCSWKRSGRQQHVLSALRSSGRCACSVFPGVQVLLCHTVQARACAHSGLYCWCALAADRYARGARLAGQCQAAQLLSTCACNRGAAAHHVGFCRLKSKCTCSCWSSTVSSPQRCRSPLPPQPQQQATVWQLQQQQQQSLLPASARQQAAAAAWATAAAAVRR